MRPGDVEIAKQLARLHHRLGNAAEAKDTLQTHLHSFPTAVDLELINILAELYMNAAEWSLAVDNIQYANAQLCGPAGLPIDLQVCLLNDSGQSSPLLQALHMCSDMLGLCRLGVRVHHSQAVQAADIVSTCLLHLCRTWDFLSEMCCFWPCR